MPNPASRPPKPRLALNVGFVGHRLAPDLPGDTALLEQALRNTLERIAVCFAQLAASPASTECHDPAIPPALRLLSPLAEGADRLAAEAALAVSLPDPLPLAYQVQCPLPFPVDEYRKDFESPDSLQQFDKLLTKIQALPGGRVLELDGDRDNDKDFAYWKLGRFLLRHSDVLVAVWNGKPGKASVGTAGVVAHAERLQMPILWISSAAPHSVYMRDYGSGDPWVALDDKQLGEWLEQRLKQLLLPPDQLATHKTEQAKIAKKALFAAAQRCCGDILPESLPQSLSEKDDMGSLRPEYFEHPVPRLTPMAWSYRLLFMLFGKRDPRLKGLWDSYQEGAAWQWAVVEQALAKLQADHAQDYQPLATELNGHTKAHMLWADQLATYYADEYRGTYVWMFFLASVAVMFALFSEPLHSVWFAFGELLVIGSIWRLWKRSEKCQFHQRWLDFRLLAELMRLRCFLLPMGGTTGLDLPEYEIGNDRSYAWVKWLARSVERIEGLPMLPMGGFNEAHRYRYGQYLSHLLCDQAGYHIRNALRNKNITNTLHWIDWILLPSIILIGSIHILEMLYPLHLPWPRIWLVIAAALLPAVGASAHGIFSHGEFLRIADRSNGMWQQLASVIVALETQKGKGLSSAELENLAEQAIDCLVQELSDWRIIFRAKPLEPSL